MKKVIKILLIIILFGCKSTSEIKNNKLDVVKTKTESTSKNIELQQLELDSNKITIHVADPKIPVIITDNKGNKKTFQNVKSLTINKKKETKIIEKSAEKKDLKETLVDKSIIKEEKEVVSDANNFKGIFIAIAFIFGFALVGYLVFIFKK